MKGFFSFSLFLFLLLTPLRPFGLPQGLDYRVHAMFVYHFTKYIEWPAQRNHDGFQVFFLEETPVISEFRKVIENKLIDNRKVSIQRLDFDNKMLRNADIIYVPSSKRIKAEQIRALSESLAGFPVLIITENEGLLKRGSMINLIVVDDKLRFEVNKSLIQSRGLKVSSELLRLASQVL
jgi:hypothetical protein